jgi:sporulation protein YunB
MRGFYRYRRRLPRSTAIRLLLLAVGAGAAVLAVFGAAQMHSMLTRLAVTRASNAVNRIVSDAVSAAVDSGEFQYERLISFEKDNEGKITALKSNMPEFNRLQSAILNRVLERISEVSTRELSIPVGSLTGIDLLAGRGPLVTVKMQSVGSSSAKLENQFTSAGINQTRHQILLKIDVSVSILLPGFTTATKVSNTFSVAETVIVGSVPGTYTYFDSGDSQTLQEDAKDYLLNGN